MDALDYWRLCDEVTVIQAALPIVDEDPADLQEDVESRVPQNRPRGYDAAKTALVHAIIGGRLPGRIVESHDDFGNGWTDWARTTVAVDDLRSWLKVRGIKTGFFFPAQEMGPDYLSPLAPNYSPKLAAAVGAWKAVSAAPDLRQGKSVKQAIVIWLRQHANEFGLSKEDGSPNEQGIEEVAKIANWDTKGGAPKTPTKT